MRFFRENRPPEFVPPLPTGNAPVRRCSTSWESASKRILIMRLAAHGDILMGTPLLTALRDAWPDAYITWVVERNAREAIDAHPLVDDVLLWKGGYWGQALRAGRRLSSPVWALRARSLRRELKRRRYDVFLSFQPEEWPFLVADVGATTSIGVFDTFRQFYSATETNPSTSLYTTAYTQADLPAHRSDQYLLPLRALGLPEPSDRRMSLGYTAEDADVVAEFLRQDHLLEGKPLVVLAPMTTWPSRCWPEERYAELGDALACRGSRVVLIGSAKERADVERVAARMRVKPLVAAGIFGFRQMAALIARASLLVSGDTGPMHVAAAVGTAHLSLFGPTPVAGRAPLAGRGIVLAHAVPCGPCDQKFCRNAGQDHLRCMRLISVEEALEAAERLLSEEAAKEVRAVGV